MAVNIGTRSNGDAIAEMNTTPLIDVMLVLLVMLIITIPIQTHAVKIDMPRGEPTPPPPAIHTLSIDFDGAITWDGIPVRSLTALDATFADIGHLADQPEVRVMPNRLAKYGRVARIMADAQRLGVKRIGFANEEQYRR